MRLAVVDSGWDNSVPDTRIVSGIGLAGVTADLTIERSNDTHDRIGHGTACANIVLDVAPNCSIVPIRVFGRRLETTPEIIVAAIDWAIDHRIRLLNLSLGTTLKRDRAQLYEACHRAAENGAIVVAAATPAGHRWSYPAVFDCTIGVGMGESMNPFEVTYRSNAAVECSVFAGRRTVRSLAGEQITVAGSSYAAPIVTGMIARWLEETPALNLESCRARMMRLGQPGSDRDSS